MARNSYSIVFWRKDIIPLQPTELKTGPRQTWANKDDKLSVVKDNRFSNENRKNLQIDGQEISSDWVTTIICVRTGFSATKHYYIQGVWGRD